METATRAIPSKPAKRTPHTDYSVIIIKDDTEGGYIGMCRELPEAKSQGETLDELLENMKDAIRLTLEVRREDQARRLAGHRPIYRRVRVTA